MGKINGCYGNKYIHCILENMHRFHPFPITHSNGKIFN